MVSIRYSHNDADICYICSDIEKIRAGIGEQVSHFMTLMVGFVICVTMSFVYGWKLTLVVIGYVPIILVTNMIISRVRAYNSRALLSLDLFFKLFLCSTIDVVPSATHRQGVVYICSGQFGG